MKKTVDFARTRNRKEPKKKNGNGNSPIPAILIIATGIVLVVTGIVVNHEETVVLNKAVRICLECIGIG